MVKGAVMVQIQTALRIALHQTYAAHALSIVTFHLFHAERFKFSKNVCLFSLNFYFNVLFMLFLVN